MLMLTAAVGSRGEWAGTGVLTTTTECLLREVHSSVGYTSSGGTILMLSTRGYAAKTATSKLEPYQFERREPGPDDVLIDIDYCGICHSDIHQIRDEWGGSIYPMVPGHEIIGRVTRVGSDVRKFKA